MATYAIGDVQGCFSQLQKLLEIIKFDSTNDVLWFTGDIVNRGPESFETLQFVRDLGDQHQVVLGNHDLHLLAVGFQTQQLKDKDTLLPILNSENAKSLLEWLRFRPLLVQHPTLNYVMTHAGLAPQWTLNEAKSLAKEVETVLQSDHPQLFFKQMYGNLPNEWNDRLKGIDRLRCITNYFTRMRYCDDRGKLDLTYKGIIENKPENLIPWFSVPHRQNKEVKIIFGHWASLNGKTEVKNIFPLDTGCVWGNCLTAMRLEDQVYFNVKCS